jgi:hypothetical protein
MDISPRSHAGFSDGRTVPRLVAPGEWNVVRDVMIRVAVAEGHVDDDPLNPRVAFNISSIPNPL